MCNCIKQREDRLSYENIKRIAEKWSAMENLELYMFKNFDGTYGFAPLEEGDISRAIEFISPVQGNPS
jgi:hypothetical protein